MIRKEKPIAALALSAIVASGAAARAQDAPLRGVTGNDYKPFADQSLPEGGLTAAIVRRAFERQGREIELEWLPWEPGRARVREGEFDFVFPWNFSDELHEGFVYSEPVYTVVKRLFFRKDGYDDPQTIDGFDGATACVPNAYSVPPTLAPAVDGGRIALEEPLDMTRCFELLALGRVDVVPVSELQGWDLARETPNLDLAEIGVSAFAVDQFSMHLLAPRANGAKSVEVVEVFNAGLAALEADGSYQEILNAHLDPEVTGRGAPAEVASTLTGRTVELEMRDGSTLRGVVDALGGGAYTLLTSFGVVTTPTSEVVSLHFEEDEEPAREATSERSVENRAALRLAGAREPATRLAPSLIEAFARAEGASEPVWSIEADRRRAEFDSRADFVQLATIDGGGAEAAFAALAAGEADIVMAPRPISEREIAELGELGDMTDPRAEHVVALDRLAVIVHPDAPIETIGTNALARIYAGELTDWSQLGAGAGPIEALAPPADAPASARFREAIGGGAPLAASIERLDDADAIAARVASNEGAIGFVDFEAIGAAKPLAIDACGAIHAPTDFAAKTEEYPLESRHYLYLSPRNENPFAADLVAFAQSEEGQRALRESGFVDLAVDLASAEDHAALRRAIARRPVTEAEAREVYGEIADGARRLSLTFRFRSASSRLDARAQRDVRRAAAWLARNEVAPEDVTLIGFADGRGGYRRNRALSRERARAVARALALEGIEGVRAIGLGEEFPVACDVDEAGWRANRRVELWVGG